MGKARWRALLLLVAVAMIILAMSFSAWGRCSDEAESCDIQQPRMFPSTSSFTIPLGTIVSALGSVVCALYFKDLQICKVIAAGVVIPDVKVTLSRTLEGKEAGVFCPFPCCIGGALWLDVYLYLEGEVFLGPEQPSATVTGIEMVEVRDNDKNDQYLTMCSILTDFSISSGGVSVDLVLPGGIELPLISTTGEIGVTPQVGYSCGNGIVIPLTNHPPALSVPTQVIIPISEGRAEFQVEAKDPDHDRLWFEAELFGVAGTVTIDETGHGEVTISPGVQISERTQASVGVVVYDLKPGVTGPPGGREQYYHQVRRVIPLVFTSNHPPQACNIEGTVYLGSPYPQTFKCVVQDPDDDPLWGPRWQSPLPGFCQDYSSTQVIPFPKEIYIVLQCGSYPELEEGDYEVSYVVWDTGSPPLWDRGTVVIHVRKNDPPVVERPG